MPWDGFPGLSRIIRTEGRRKLSIVLWNSDLSRTPTEINRWIDKIIESMESELARPDIQEELQAILDEDGLSVMLERLPQLVYGKKWEPFELD